MTNNFFNAPDYITCHFCKENVANEYILDPHTQSIVELDGDPIQYSCPNHKPLNIEYTLIRVSNNLNETDGKWIPHRIFIYQSTSFRLFWSCSFRDKSFYLQEYQKYIPVVQIGGWSIFNSTKFPFDWVLKQSPKRLLSILEMYRTFG